MISHQNKVNKDIWGIFLQSEIYSNKKTTFSSIISP